MDPADDAQLLRDYVASGSEMAFRTLVERHLGLVQATALRQLDDHHQAEEVSQAVFLLLARKASLLPRGIVLAGWLHRTTHFVAERTRRAESRRKEREQKAFAMQDPAFASTANPWSDLAPVLDDALLALADTDRHAILLRYFERRNHREIASALGLGDEAAKKRIARALEKLRLALGRAGVSVSAVTLAQLLGEQGCPAAPIGIAARLLEPIFTPANPPSTGESVLRLVSETLAAWRRTRRMQTTGWILGTIGGAALLVALATALVRPPGPSIPIPTRSVAMPPIAESTPASRPQLRPVAMTTPNPGSPAEKELLLFVVDALTGAPIPQAPVQYRFGSLADLLTERKGLQTDSNGVVALRYPPNILHLVADAIVPNYAARFVRFDPHRGEIVPDTYTLRLERVDRPVGGVIRAPDGRPVAGAALEVAFFSHASHSDREPTREGTGTAKIMGSLLARTDAEGRWSSTMIPPAHPGFSIRARHPNFASTRVIDLRPGLAPTGTEAADPAAQLWARTLTTTMRPGLRLAGRVVDADGRPVPGAELVHAPRTDDEHHIRAGEDGAFVWEGVPAGRFRFTATARGHAPKLQEIEVAEGMPPVEVSLGRRETLRLRFVDPDGAGIPGVWAVPEGWDGAGFFWLEKSRADGRLEWPDAPAGETLQLSLLVPGSTDGRDISAVVDGREHELVLTPVPVVQGRVVDATSGLPIAEFRAVEGNPGGWRRMDTYHGRNGDLRLVLNGTEPPYRIRVEAEGYHPFVAEELTDLASPLEVRLRRAEASKALHGTVLTPEGTPAAGIQVDLVLPQSQVQLGRRVLGKRPSQNPILSTSADGSFRFPPEAEGNVLVAAGESGFARLAIQPEAGPATVRLEPWGSLHGTIDRSLMSDPPPRVWITSAMALRVIWIPMSSEAVPDAAGRFAFDSLPPGDYRVELRGTGHEPGHHRRNVTVVPGSPTQVTLGDSGLRIRGRLVFPASEIAASPAPAWVVSFAPRDLPLPTAPTPIERSWTPEERTRWEIESLRLGYLRQTVLIAEVDAHGGFASPEGLPPGEFRLGIHRVPKLPHVPDAPGRRPAGIQEAHRRFMTIEFARHQRPLAEIPITVPTAAEGLPQATIHDLGDLPVSLPPTP